jgi:hypothetical protein
MPKYYVIVGTMAGSKGEVLPKDSEKREIVSRAIRYVAQQASNEHAVAHDLYATEDDAVAAARRFATLYGLTCAVLAVDVDVAVTHVSNLEPRTTVVASPGAGTIATPGQTWRVGS